MVVMGAADVAAKCWCWLSTIQGGCEYLLSAALATPSHLFALSQFKTFRDTAFYCTSYSMYPRTFHIVMLLQMIFCQNAELTSCRKLHLTQSAISACKCPFSYKWIHDRFMIGFIWRSVTHISNERNSDVLLLLNHISMTVIHDYNDYILWMHTLRCIATLLFVNHPKWLLCHEWQYTRCSETPYNVISWVILHISLALYYVPYSLSNSMHSCKIPRVEKLFALNHYKERLSLNFKWICL